VSSFYFVVDTIKLRSGMSVSC